MSVENVNPQEELKWLDVQIQLATDLAALKPLYFRLNEIISAFPGDFDVQFTGNEIKQRLMARGTLLKQRETSPPPPARPAGVPPTAEIVLPPAPPAPYQPPVTPTGTPSQGSYPFFEPPPEQQPPAPFAGTFENPPQPPTLDAVPPQAPPRRAGNWKRVVIIGSIAGLLIAVVLVSLMVLRNRKRQMVNTAAVQVDITTNPAGASVKVVTDKPVAGAAKESTCTSNCRLPLTPGTYQISAFLDGFEPAAGSVIVKSGQPAGVSLTLPAQAQSLRLLSDLAQGKVAVDDRPPVDLQDGQLILDKVAPGTHTVKVTGQNASASFSFETGDARLPVVTGPVTVQNIIAVMVASFRKQARIVTSAGPWKLAVNGQPQSDAGPAGTDLTGFQTGVNEIVIGEGKDQRNMSESFSGAPMLTAFLKMDVNAGTLIVATGQDDVRVFLNDKEYRRSTQRGQLRVQTLGKVTVRVAKNGFQDEPAQTVEVKKGAEVRLQFDLKPQPQFGALQIHGAAAGTEVMVDQKSVGTVAADGSFSLNTIPPGDHMIELRREQYTPKQLQRSFQAGHTVTLAAGDVTLAAASGTIRLTRTPASASVTYRRGDETEQHEVRGNQIELPPGNYAFSASAPGFTDSTVRVQLAAGENKGVDLNLVRERPAAPPPVVTNGMAEFEDAQGWKKDGDTWAHKGGGFVAYKLPPKGVFTFTVQLVKGGGRSGQVRWCLQYLDSKNYLLYELDRKTFWAGVIEKGKRLERVKTAHNLGNPKTATIQIEVAPDHLVQKVRVGDEWKVLDSFAEPGRDFTAGKFGFLILGTDEIAVSDFKFTPK